jgi:Uri superfamily endonuclease
LKGAYALVLRISQPLNTNVGSLGALQFESGIWVYIGSAMGKGSTSLENRLKRHFSSKKTIFWHIDWLLASGAIPLTAIWTKSSEKIECQLSEALIKSPVFESGPKGFGASDCRRSCGTHLFQYIGKNSVNKSLQEVFIGLGFDPQIFET